MAGVVGSVSSLWRFPVKSMKGEQINQAAVSSRGVAGDRAYALVDTDTGKVVSAKSVKLFPGMFNCRAEYLEDPLQESEAPPIRIELPDGQQLLSDSNNVDELLSDYFQRKVTLAKSAPENFTIDMYHPDLEDFDAKGRRDVFVDQKLGAALFADLGLPSPVEVGQFFDCFPMSVVTTSSLNRLNELEPESRFDLRRFRMNVVIETNEAGFVENNWVGHQLAIGDSARLRVIIPDARCVMTTLPQDDLPKDMGILKALAQHNRVQVGNNKAACLGVYAIVEEPGIIREGDPVMLI